MPTIKQLHRLWESYYEFPETRKNHSGNGFGLLPDPKPLYPKKLHKTKGRLIGYYIWNPVIKEIVTIPCSDREFKPPKKPTEKSFFTHDCTTSTIVFDGKKLIVVPKTDSI